MFIEPVRVPERFGLAGLDDCDCTTLHHVAPPGAQLQPADDGRGKWEGIATVALTLTALRDLFSGS